MSNRRDPLPAAEQLRLGELVLAMRGSGACWKKIERELGRGRVQLWRYLRLARRAERMKQKTRRMKHHEDCPAA